VVCIREEIPFQICARDFISLQDIGVLGKRQELLPLYESLFRKMMSDLLPGEPFRNRERVCQDEPLCKLVQNGRRRISGAKRVFSGLNFLPEPQYLDPENEKPPAGNDASSLQVFGNLGRGRAFGNHDYLGFRTPLCRADPKKRYAEKEENQQKEDGTNGKKESPLTGHVALVARIRTEAAPDHRHSVFLEACEVNALGHVKSTSGEKAISPRRHQDTKKVICFFSSCLRALVA
jgi:hypothetical protein